MSPNHDTALAQVELAISSATLTATQRKQADQAYQALRLGEVRRLDSGAVVCLSSGKTWQEYRCSVASCECEAGKRDLVCWHRFAARCLVLYEDALAALEAEVVEEITGEVVNCAHWQVTRIYKPSLTTAQSGATLQKQVHKTERFKVLQGGKR